MKFIELLREKAEVKQAVQDMTKICHICKKEGDENAMYTMFNDAHGIMYIHEYHRAQGYGMEEPDTQEDREYQESAEEHGVGEEPVEIPHGVPNI